MNFFIGVVQVFWLQISKHLFSRTTLNSYFWYKNKQFHNIWKLDQIYLEQMLENSKALGFLAKIDTTLSTLISTS